MRLFLDIMRGFEKQYWLVAINELLDQELLGSKATQYLSKLLSSQHQHAQYTHCRKLLRLKVIFNASG